MDSVIEPRPLTLPRRRPGGAPPAAWPRRWSQLARALGLSGEERYLVALSGGADSVLLLHLLAGAVPRPRFRAAHVAHGLRGAEGEADAEFCETLCRSLGVPFRRLAIELDPQAPGLEARARELRYAALCAEARATGHTTLLTGHHADDALETLLLRWVRGTHGPGLGGIPRRTRIRGRSLAGTGPVAAPDADPGAPLEPVQVVRPLTNMRREEVRALLKDRGLTWREDASNRDPRFARNQVRNVLLPALDRACGSEGLENLRAFGKAVESLEDELARKTAHLAWAAPSFALASRDPGRAALGGILERAPLMELPAPLRRRALWRLLTEGTGHAPRRALLEQALDDLSRGRCTRHTLPGRWTLVLRSGELQLLPPPEALGPPRGDAVAPPRGAPPQPLLPFPAQPDAGPWGAGALDSDGSFDLRPPGIVTLPDGRRLSAEVYAAERGAPVPLGRSEIELDADGLPEHLTVRWMRSGDRFHPLGAPGSKSLRRFLADSGVPRDERDRVPLVCAEDQILWVVGLRPSERWRVRPSTTRRLRLCLHASAAPRPGAEPLPGEA